MARRYPDEIVLLLVVEALRRLARDTQSEPATGCRSVSPPCSWSATLGDVDTALAFLLYADDGARLVYAGHDRDQYERHCRALTEHHAGSLTGRRPVGKEQWLVRSYFVAEPPASFIASRRGYYQFKLTWEPVESAGEA